jgi:hypothetical protein
MAITTQLTESTQITATVSVRVSQNTENDLISAAEQRLSAIETVSDASVTGLDDIDPRLSATVVTVTAGLDTDATVTDVREALSETVAIEAVTDIN